MTIVLLGFHEASQKGQVDCLYAGRSKAEALAVRDANRSHRSFRLCQCDLGINKSNPNFTPRIKAEETPAEETPAEETPAEETPAEETPAEETPAEETPAEETPAEETPASTRKRK